MRVILVLMGIPRVETCMRNDGLIFFFLAVACSSSTEKRDPVGASLAEKAYETAQKGAKMSSEEQKKIEADLNSMSAEEIYKLVDNHKELTLSIPGETLMGKREDFTHEFVDDFRQKGRWATGETAKYALSYVTDGYRFEHKDPNSLQSSYVPLGVLSDKKPWAFEVKVRVISANPDANIGLLLGGNEKGDRFIFNINPSQKSYSFGKMHNNQWVVLQSGSNEVIMKEDTYILRAEYVHGRQQLFMNHFFIGGKEGQLDLFGELFGFIVDGKATILVDYVKISWS